MPTNSKEYVQKNIYKYWKNPKARAKNAARKRARRLLEKEWRVKPHDGKEVDHKDGNVFNNAKSNLRVLPAKKNRYLGAKKRNGK